MTRNLRITAINANKERFSAEFQRPDERGVPLPTLSYHSRNPSEVINE